MSISRKRMFGHKIGVVILAVLMVLGMAPGLLAPGGGKAYAAEDAYSGEGAGTTEDPYLIATADQLNEVRDHLDAHFKLIADINLSGFASDPSNPSLGWEPIGNGTAPFQGSMDGNGYKITNLMINKPKGYDIGLFGYSISGAVFTHMKLENVNIFGSSNTGGLVGHNVGGTISNSYVMGDILIGSGEWDMGAGGLVGNNENAKISNSYALGNVSGGDNIGGLIGTNFGGEISNSYAAVILTGGRNYIGGLVGYNWSGGFSYCFYDSDKTGQSDAGKGEGKSTGEMKTQTTFTNWDFENIWAIDTSLTINDGYPYLQEVHVNYMGNGSTGGDVPVDTAYFPAGTANVLGVGNLVKTGYSFTGWNTAADGTGTSYEANDTLQLEGDDVTLYAQWTINLYTVTYDDNSSDDGTVPDAVKQNYNTTVTVAGNPGSLTRTGYTFAGWNTAEDGTGTSYVTDDTFQLGANDVTLYACWTINQYKVTYSGNDSDGGSVPDAVYHDYHTAVTVAGNPGNLTRTGYTLTGWGTAADGSGTSYEADDTFTLGVNDITLYPVWSVNAYTVKFNSSGGSAVGDVQANYGTKIAAPDTPVREGYTFAGWYKEVEFTNEWDFDADTVPVDGITLYARWTVNQYEVTYNGNGSNGGTVPAAVTKGYNTTITVAGNPGNLTRTGHTFTGWNTAADGTGTSYQPGSTFVLGTNDVALYAQWYVNSYTVNFISNGGSVVGDVQADYGTKIAAPDTPEREGYTFTGWYKEAGFVNEWDFDADPVPVHGITLYAQWTVNSYTVAYDDNGSDEGDVPDAVTQDYNTTVTVADNTGSLTREGYAFAGWNTTADGNGTSYAAGAAFDMGAMNMTLYAQWFSTDAQLSDLAVDQGILTPAFKASELAYRVDVANRVTSLNFTFAKGDSNQTFTVTGADYQSVTGDVYGYSASNLLAGPNTIQIAVFAQDGTTQNIYNLTVNRALAYTITFDGNGATSGNAPTDGESYEQGAAIPVSGNTGNLAKQGYTFAGWNTAANGSGTSYAAGDTISMGTANVTLYAKWASSDAMLGGLSVSSGTLNFIPSKLNYTVDVDNEVNTIDIAITKSDPNQTLKVTGSVYQTVTDSVYHYAASNLAVGANLIQIQVSAQDGITTKEYSITVTRAAAPSSGGDGGGGPAGGTDATNPTNPTEQNETDLNVTIDGGPGQPIATATTSEQDGQTVLTVAVDAAKLTEQLEQSGDKPVVTIPVTTSADKVIAALTGDAVEAMENKNAVLDIQTPIGSYKLPATEIRVDLLAVMLRGQGRESDIAVHVDIAKSDEAKVGLLWDAANSGSFTIVAPPIDFTVTATLGDKSVTIDTFSSYVEREIPIPDGVDASKITAAVALSKDGTTRSVSMKIVMRDGKSYAVINSLTNSTYALVSHQVTFGDIANHWAKKAINEMGSRLVISGTSDSLFSPDRDITRAEFAAIIVRGLGLKPENGISAFSDVEAGAWYSSVVNTAYEYRLINGFGDGMFRPNDKITREQAMVMIAKAMEITKLEGVTSEQSAMNVLRPFTDAKEVSSWAMDGVADSVQAGIVSGRDSNNLDPKRFITRAEVAIIIQRLLEKSDLI